ncbi:MAG: hypothetical protein ACTHJJ_03415 [Intrasporangium sp.]|uniref:hypothetical protein n=1 Tax=Intrasporangium sp. TaxID=1925024 RepID=UPI003F7E884D
MKITSASVTALGAAAVLGAAALTGAAHATASSGGAPDLAGPLSASGAPALAAVTTTSPVAYADNLVRAWGRGDRQQVDQLGTASVARALFAYSDPGGVSWRRTWSLCAPGTNYATYHDDARGGTVTIGVSDVLLSEGRQHAAYQVRFSQAHPIGPVAYADRLVQAWGRGDRRAAASYATPRVANILFAHADPGGSHWRRVSSSGAAGTTYVTYHDDLHGGHLVLAVHNAAEQDGQLHAVYDARFTR